MADVNPNFAIRNMPTNPLTWTPVICPITCAQIVIQNVDGVNAQRVRSDAADSSTEKGLPAGMELTLRASRPLWGAGTTVCFLLAAAGQGPVCVSFLP